MEICYSSLSLDNGYLLRILFCDSTNFRYLEKDLSALARWLSWLEHHLDAPRFQVQSPVRVHTSINQ